jgi:peptide-methionine (S)-S-oxide reductase
MKKATFGAGCFWHVDDEFAKVKGVLKTIVGYMGGKTKNPSYESVCSDKTGHVEVCQVEYDPRIISYEKLLHVFWKMHDPTQFNRQGPDVGSQYTSVIFFHDENQKKIALASKEKEQNKRKVVTEILPAEIFYEAEEYHQKYLMKQGRNSCRVFT